MEVEGVSDLSQGKAKLNTHLINTWDCSNLIH